MADLVYVEFDTADAEPGTDDLWVRADTIAAIKDADEGAQILVDGWFINIRQNRAEIMNRLRSALDLAAHG